jgi:hypothetical protein
MKTKSQTLNNNNMEVFYEKQVLFFLVPLIISTLLGYLFHDLVTGVTNGVVTGIISLIHANYFIKK